jgi:3-hydroxyisobutyrate dehydrogenase-like beta-hydroxyacid dehydrogenase
MKVGFVGLGQMGSGMAANLVRAGHRVTVWNRTASRTESLARQGAIVAPAIAAACLGDVVFTMLANDDALEETVFGEGGILASMPARALHISSSTISPALADRLAAAHAEAGQRFICAPVFGRPDAAAAGKLFVIAAGPVEDVRLAAPLFEVIGQRTFEVSQTPSLANLVKLSGNFLIASVLESLGEAFALVGKAGVDSHQYLEILTSTLFNAPVYKTYGTLMADRKFTPAGFAVPLGQKDIRLTLAAAEALNVPMPVASLLRDRFLALTAAGGSDLDWSAVGALAARDAGTYVLPSTQRR